MSENTNSIYSVPGHTQAEDTLLSYPPAIQAMKKEVLERTQEIELKAISLKKMVLDFKVGIQKNNPDLKNADQRLNALDKKLEEDKEYLAALKEIQDLKYELEIVHIDLDYMQNMFKAHLAIVGGHR